MEDADKVSSQKRSLYRRISAIPQAIGIIITGMLFVCCFIWQPGMYMDARERIHFDRSGILFYVVLFLLLFFWIRHMNFMRKYNPRSMFLILSAIYIAAAIYLIHGTDAPLRGDPSMVMKYVEAFNHGDYSGLLPGKYLNFYPFQLGFLTYERLLSVVSTTPHFLFSANFCLVILINYLNWKITDLLSGRDRLAVNYSIILSFAFLPQFFYILWPYGQIPGLLFTELAVYFMIRADRENKPLYWIPMILFISIACLLKPNYMIAAAAIGIVFLLKLIKTGKWKCLLAVLLVALSVSGSQKAVKAYYSEVSRISIGEGSPMILHITMGMQDTGNGTLGGWYNGYAFDTYKDCGYDSDKAAEIGRRDLAERIAVYQRHPGYAVRFFGKKIVSTWCEPTFQSLWSGALEDCGQNVKGILLQSIYTAGIAYEILKLFMHIVLIIIYGIVFCGILFRKKLYGSMQMDPLELYSIIYLTGGFLYHLISETKSQYVYMYVYCLIPLAAMTISRDWNKKHSISK
jgi:hypothetical protein